ncbi:MAG TPA: PspC domain-containing protein [Elusimicrobiales bacterium]|nr:PspC domain-containing protein [Elusimicrobiales bacterium]
MTKYPKKLYRSREDRILFGILGGLGKYFNIDSVLLRVIFVVLLVLTGFVPFGLTYLIVYFIVPLEPEAKEDIHQTTAKEE